MLLRECHVWYGLRLTEERPRPPLPDGYEIFRATDGDVPLIAGLAGTDEHEARKRLARGAELWLIRRGDDIAYSGWVFHGHAPTIAGPGGRVRLPPDTANPEDMVTAPAHQGRGLASAAYGIICDDLRRDGRAEHIVGKVPCDNVANRRAVEKAGWWAFAQVDFLRVGPWRRTTVVGSSPPHAAVTPDMEAMRTWLEGAMHGTVARAAPA